MYVIGTSGWQYRDWRDRFYPRELRTEDWLPFFATRFASVEVNNSFYRLPSAETFGRWAAQVPDDFIVTVKASRYISHVKRLRDPEEPMALLWERMQPLGSKRGPVLLQLPPRFAPDVGRLRATLAAIPDGMRLAVELRDRRWERDDVFELLDEAGCAFVYADRPRARVPEVHTGGWAYVRFHRGRLDAWGYERRKLERWADRLARLSGEVYVYFNNDPGGAAVLDADKMTGLLLERGCEIHGLRQRAGAATRT